VCPGGAIRETGILSSSASFSFEKFRQLTDSPRRKTPHVLQIAFKSRAVGHGENSLVPFVPTPGVRKNFEHPDRPAAEN
jgi:hypothetical protein